MLLTRYRSEMEHLGRLAPEFLVPRYVILFDSSDDRSGEFKQTVSSADTLRTILAGRGTFPLTFDRTLSPAVPALWFVMHLPRNAHDLVDLPALHLRRSQKLSIAHHVELAPWPTPAGLLDPTPQPLIVLTADSAFEAVQQDRRFDHALVMKRFSELNDDVLRSTCDRLGTAYSLDDSDFARHLAISPTGSTRPTQIPNGFVAFHFAKHDPDALPALFSSADEALQFARHCQALLSATADLEERKLTPAEAEPIFLDTLREHKVRLRCPVVAGVPGVSPRAASRELARALKKARLDLPSLQGEEIDVLGQVVAHRAAARLGIGFVSESISDAAFEALARLEGFVGDTGAKAIKLRRLLDNLSGHALSSFSDQQLRALAHASGITSFSEFPIGLMTLPGDTAPLACRSPIAYRPIVPLTRALQFELSSFPMHYVRDRLRILVAECIPTGDPIATASRAAWRHCGQQLEGISNVEFELREVHNVNELRTILRDEHFDALVLSAHGSSDADSHRTGFVCGDELIVEEELGHVPPIVILSMCQIAPRGQGTANFSDLLFRQGAAAVIGTLIPIGVFKHGILMSRFFVYLAEALSGRGTHQNLAEIWHFVVTSNAVAEILLDATRTPQWLRECAHQILAEFMNNRSAGKVRRGHLYVDTEELLAEILDERGLGTKFREWLSRQGYIPQSLFYVAMGWPERIIVYDEEFERVRGIEQAAGRW